MTAALQPYPEYKDSGLPWLGRIPVHWDVRRLRHCGRIVGGGTPAMNRPDFWNGSIPWVSAKDMKAPCIDDSRDHVTESALRETKTRLLPSHAVLLVTRGMILARHVPVAVNRVPVAINQDMKAILPREDVDCWYLMYAIGAAADPLSEMIDEAGHGTKRLPNDRWRQLQVWMPPFDEQEAIANYLDANATRVNRFIRNRQRLIEVLNEQKQAIINQAVTRGLDPNVPIKPSGVKWLGEIPAHWKVCKIKRIAHVDPSRSEASGWRDSGEQVVFLPMERVSVDGDVDASERRPIHEVWQGFTYFRRGDVVVAKITPCFENGKGACLSGLETEMGFGTTEFIVLRPSHAVSSEFLYQLTMLAEFRLRGVESMTGAAGQQRVSPAFVGNFVVPLPPKHEQEQIMSFVSAETARLRTLIARAQREIDLVREYRARLVADVVTGKLDVRRALAAETKVRVKTPANVHFRRSVFAAEIVHRLHAEPTFGHVKFEKLIFLCEKRCGLDLGSTYHRQAAGPYDNRALRSIDSQIKKQKWYEGRKGDKGYRYVPLEKAGCHSEYFSRYFGEVVTQFDEIINTFRTLNTERCEIVATLYAAWEDLLTKGNASDDQIVEQVLHHWHPSKQRIAENRWRRALEWMKTKNLIPDVKMGKNDAKEEQEDSFCDHRDIDAADLELGGETADNAE